MTSAKVPDPQHFGFLNPKPDPDPDPDWHKYAGKEGKVSTKKCPYLWMIYQVLGCKQGKEE